MRFFQTPHFDFMRARKVSYAFSAVLALIGLFSIFVHGPNYSIDFTGGSLVQGFFKTPVALADVRQALEKGGLKDSQLQTVPSRNAIIIRFKAAAGEKDESATRIASLFGETFPDNPFEVERVEYVGPVVGRHLIRQALMAIFFSLLGISIYVGFRFRNWVWGFCGVFALLHDVFIAAGLLNLVGRELSITVIAALLTLAGFSINDTIVVFDRMRENLRGRQKESLDAIINRSLNETLSRSVITSLTVFFVVLSLLFWGGEVLRDFSMAMTFGVVIGSYSSIFLAAPMIYDWQQWQRRRAQQQRKR